MRVQAEVSLYPLRVKRLSGPVNEFCQVLQSRGLHIQIRSMSTFVVGESERLFDALKGGFEVVARRSEVVMDLTISNTCPEATEQDLAETGKVD
jgi:uncharacterized protein YqgV (UPF0045/DUF77 family)